MAARHVFPWLVLLCLYFGKYQCSSSDTRYQLPVNYPSTSVGEIDGWFQQFRCSTADNVGIGSYARHRKRRGNFYLHVRKLYSVNGSSSYQVTRLALCGDIHINPGPARKSTVPKFPCKECGKAVRSNQGAILCSQCKCCCHAKCLQLSRAGFQYYLDHSDLDWVCALCSLPKLAPEDFTDSSLELVSSLLECPATVEQGEYANDGPLNSSSRIVVSRQRDERELLIMHLNINSLQKKLEDLKQLISDFKAQVIFLSETKIDSSYPSKQFKIDGYNIYRKDRVKGGGGVMAYVSSSLSSKKLKLPRNFTTFEALAQESQFGRHDAVVLGIYRPPKAVGKDYYNGLESDLNDIISWASLQRQLIVVTGDLNMDRLEPDEKEGKILCDLEQIHNLGVSNKEANKSDQNKSNIVRRYDDKQT